MHFSSLAVISALTAFMSVTATPTLSGRQQCSGANEPCIPGTISCCFPFVCTVDYDNIGLCGLSTSSSSFGIPTSIPTSI
ncbi:hypothetical protein BDR04DRAFT_1104361 [Suillus decipiens]|nr:hypothetical protein BDR04DRAFT_1104361 [Suillus decipiens]